ncbi:hypothetical protein GQX74_011438 [Glossina fuscipes]|nr:hypothetical protein GQX74_011438 [Glossina fuscipes]
MQKILSNSVSKLIISSPSPRSASPKNDFLLNTRCGTIDDNNGHRRCQLGYSDICARDADFLEPIETHSKMYLPPTVVVSKEEEDDEIPIDCFENFSKSASFTRRIRQVKALSLQHLQNIANHTSGNKDPKLITYHEWVCILLRLNELFVNKIEALKSEMAEQLEYFRRTDADRRRIHNIIELKESHRDIDALIKIIQNAFHNGVWDFQSLFLETISGSQVFGVGKSNTAQKKPSPNALKQKRTVLSVKVDAFELESASLPFCK